MPVLFTREVEHGFVERGEREIGIGKLWALAHALDVPVTDLFDFRSLPATLPKAARPR